MEARSVWLLAGEVGLSKMDSLRLKYSLGSEGWGWKARLFGEGWSAVNGTLLILMV